MLLYSGTTCFILDTAIDECGSPLETIMLANMCCWISITTPYILWKLGNLTTDHHDPAQNIFLDKLYLEFGISNLNNSHNCSDLSNFMDFFITDYYSERRGNLLQWTGPRALQGGSRLQYHYDPDGMLLQLRRSLGTTVHQVSYIWNTWVMPFVMQI